jgi:hypothetical protein
LGRFALRGCRSEKETRATGFPAALAIDDLRSV